MSDNWIKHRHPNFFKRIYSDVMGWISHVFLDQYLKWGTTWELDLQEKVDKDEF